MDILKPLSRLDFFKLDQNLPLDRNVSISIANFVPNPYLKIDPIFDAKGMLENMLSGEICREILNYLMEKMLLSDVNFHFQLLPDERIDISTNQTAHQNLIVSQRWFMNYRESEFFQGYNDGSVLSSTLGIQYVNSTGDISMYTDNSINFQDEITYSFNDVKINFTMNDPLPGVDCVVYNFDYGIDVAQSRVDVFIEDINSARYRDYIADMRCKTIMNILNS